MEQPHASQPFQMQIHAALKQAEQDEQPPAITINWPNTVKCPYF